MVEPIKILEIEDKNKARPWIRAILLSKDSNHPTNKIKDC